MMDIHNIFTQYTSDSDPAHRILETGIGWREKCTVHVVPSLDKVTK